MQIPLANEVPVEIVLVPLNAPVDVFLEKMDTNLEELLVA